MNRDECVRSEIAIVTIDTVFRIEESRSWTKRTGEGGVEDGFGQG